MAIPQLETSFCGCSVKTGTKIIGWFSMVTGVLMVIAMVWRLVAIYYIEDHPEIDNKETEIIRAHLLEMKAIAIFLIVACVLASALAFILLLGTYKKKANLVYIWVIVSLAIILVKEVVSLIQALTIDHSSALADIIYFFINCYFILVVYSFYREMGRSSTYP